VSLTLAGLTLMSRLSPRAYSRQSSAFKICKSCSRLFYRGRFTGGPAIVIAPYLAIEVVTYHML
jgi:hypothetical protein